jgi:ABC-type antimicrobial peptide transport system permease subunit
MVDVHEKEAISALKRGEILVSLNTANNLKIKKDQIIEIATFDAKYQLLDPIASMKSPKKRKAIIESGLAQAKKKGLIKKFKVGGIIKNNLSQTAASFFIDKKIGERLLGSPPLISFEINTTVNESPSMLKEKVQNILDNIPIKRTFEPTVVVRRAPKQIFVFAPAADITADEQQKDLWKTDPQGIILGLSFLIMIISISTSSISGTMTNSVVERRHELGIMHAIGVTPKQIKAVILLESTILSLLGWLVGIFAALIIGVTSSFGSALAMEQLGVAFNLQLPWNLLLFSVLIVLVMGFLSGIYPARKAAMISKTETYSYE